MRFQSQLETGTGALLRACSLPRCWSLWQPWPVIVVVKSVLVHSIDDNGADTPSACRKRRLSIRARDRMNPALTRHPRLPRRPAEKDGGASIQWDSKDGDSDKGLSVAGEFRTRDSLSQVVEFIGRASNAALVSNDDWDNSRSAKLEYRSGGVRQVISIHRRTGKPGSESRHRRACVKLKNVAPACRGRVNCPKRQKDVRAYVLVEKHCSAHRCDVPSMN